MQVSGGGRRRGWGRGRRERGGSVGQVRENKRTDAGQKRKWIERKCVKRKEKIERAHKSQIILKYIRKVVGDAPFLLNF